MTADGTVEVSSPASSANLGPGFDALGLALELRNTYAFAPGPRDHIEVTGKFAERIPVDPARNLAFRAFRSVAPSDAGAYALHAHRAIPSQGGMGSSASAIVAGLVAANATFGLNLSTEVLLAKSAEIEGHADNVAPALLGGLVVTVADAGRIQSVRVPFPTEVGLVLIVPDYRVPTVRARRVLPDLVPRKDAVANLARAALLIAALQQGRYEVLRTATEDFLHQPYRLELNPALQPCMTAALLAGAYGAALSGSGPTILAFAPRDKNISIATAMADACLALGRRCESYVLGCAETGARVITTAA
ncbi:MAG: homoserine kinase [Actinobacteria bacterium]|nr:homoserine kinase [Actinomycetota bacterium]